MSPGQEVMWSPVNNAVYYQSSPIMNENSMALFDESSPSLSFAGQAEGEDGRPLLQKRLVNVNLHAYLSK